MCYSEFTYEIIRGLWRVEDGSSEKEKKVDLQTKER